MKKFLVFMLLALLSGCGSEPVPTLPPTEPEVTEATALPTEPAGYYDPDSALEEISQGALKLYPLNRSESTAIIPYGEDLLLVSGYDGTTLSVLSGQNLYVSAVANLDCYANPDAPSFLATQAGVTYYDMVKQEFVLLTPELKELKRIPLPEDTILEPCVSRDRKMLYYLTAEGIRGIDLETGLDRLLRQMDGSGCELVNLHCGDTLLEVAEYREDGMCTLFIDTGTGQTLRERPVHDSLWTNDSHYFTFHYDGAYRELIYGSDKGTSVLTLPDMEADVFPLLDQKYVISVSGEDDGTELNCYHLETGMRTASLLLENTLYCYSFQAEPDTGCVWFLGYDEQYSCDVLYRWDTLQQPVEDPHIYLTARRSADNPDLEGLTRCAQQAQTLSEKYGVEILVWEDATAYESWDYSLIPEYQVPLVERGLETLDRALAHFPKGFLKTAAACTGSGKIRICLVRDILGNPDANALDSVIGLQFWNDDGDSYFALAVGDQTEQTLYHELFHIIDGCVFSRSSAYDNWNSLNPEGFDYDYDYVANLARDDHDLLTGESKAFIDMYSMSYPKEDRARLFEYAMMPDNAYCFESGPMQQKLHQLCLGIREAFRLKKSTEVFQWEQYLNTPLAAE